ncbi:MAG: zinc ABC transporter substrate-binding protein [Oscillospiraceae bacterium]|nr:zinc ABC transporter substrate-binding protein [Oscillospiraceae bacterium]
MKHTIPLILVLCLLLCGCSSSAQPAQVAATTLPVYTFTSRLCEGTGISVTQLVTEAVSCLHDYSLNVSQVKAAEAAELIVISGAGLEEFMEDLLPDTETIDSSRGISLIWPEEAHHEHDHDHGHGSEEHHHDQDPHIWLSPANARLMAANIWEGLCRHYPAQEPIFTKNLHKLTAELDLLESYAAQSLEKLSCRELITFHDGFAYFAEAFDLQILEAVEEESGSEASAKELIHLIQEVEHHNLPAIFTEKNGSVSAAGIIARETGCESFALDMAMSGNDYFDAMYHNINTIKEALG